MNTYIFQVVSGLRITDTSNTDYQSMITPMASYLLLAGDIGDPTHPHFQRFMCWCSANWERVWFIAGQMETGFESACRFVASKLHNVRFMQRQVEWGIPGLHIVAASCWPPEQTESHATFLTDNCGPDALLLTYSVPQQMRSNSLQYMHWVYGLACDNDSPPRSVINLYRVPGRMYDHTFYIPVTVNPATFYFHQGTDAFPSGIIPTVVRTVEARMPQTSDNMCFYCGHRNHSKLRCPLIQCNTCFQFGHNERVCKAPRNFTSSTNNIGKVGLTKK